MIFDTTAFYVMRPVILRNSWVNFDEIISYHYITICSFICLISLKLKMLKGFKDKSGSKRIYF